MIKGQKTAYFGAFRDPIKKAMHIITWYSPANITYFIALIGIKCKFDKVAPMKNYLKPPKISRRSAPQMCRIRRKTYFQRPPKYTYLGAFGVKLKIKFSKKKNNRGGGVPPEKKTPTFCTLIYLNYISRVHFLFFIEVKKVGEKIDFPPKHFRS